MRGKDIKLLREKSEIRYSNREMAQLLGINERTLINWENSDDELSPPYQVFLGQLFEDVVIKEAQQILNRLFDVVPAEHMALWFYLGHGKIVLFRNSARHQNISGALNESYSFFNDEIIKDLDDTSLTTAPMAYAVTINEAGDAICNHRYKSFAGKGTRYVHYLHNRSLESIVKLPRFIKGPKPLYLLSVENKLAAVGDSYQVIPADGSGQKIFTEEDVESLILALEKEESEGLIDLLTMFFIQ